MLAALGMEFTFRCCTIESEMKKRDGRPGPRGAALQCCGGKPYSPSRASRSASSGSDRVSPAPRESRAAPVRRRRPEGGGDDLRAGPGMVAAGCKPWVGPGRPARGGNPGRRGGRARLAGSVSLTRCANPVVLQGEGGAAPATTPGTPQRAPGACGGFGHGWWLAEGLVLLLRWP